MSPPTLSPPLVALLFLAACSAGSTSLDPTDSTTSSASSTTVATATSTTSTTTTLPGTGFTIVTGRVDQPAGWFPAAVAHQLIETLGFDVTQPSARQLPAFAAYPALATGSLDLWATGQTPGDDIWQDAEVEPGVTISSLVTNAATLAPGGAHRGFVINRTLAEDLGITSLTQIDQTPELAALFDREGDGASDISGCPFDSACADAIDAIIDEAAWANVTQTRGGTGALINDAEARIARGEPVIAYLESPTAFSARLAPGQDTLWLALATFEDDNLLPDSAPAEHCTASPCWTGFASADIGIVANSDTLASHPTLAALLAAVEIPAEDLATAALQVDRGLDSDDALDGLAAAWIADNQSLVDTWIDDALDAA